VELLAIAVAGAGVGLTVAAAPGPVGMLVAGSARHGWRVAAAAAAGVACADLSWAAVAAGGGAALAGSPFVAATHWLARGALLVVGLLVLHRGIQLLAGRTGAPAAADRERTRPVRWFATTFGLTVPNPLTVGIFAAAAVDAGVRAGGAASTVLVFALAAGAASLSWQLSLAGAGRWLLVGRGPRATGAVNVACGCLLLGWALL
jgi:threonine/homoserine/homoserine lactone efflux protein